jgi:hypothetical protein
LKYLFLIMLILLNGCATPQERRDKADRYKDLANASDRRAAELGELKGTPENMDAIAKAEGQANSYSDSARDARFGRFWVSIFDSILDD